MKKLGKKLDSSMESIEAYACTTCGCEAYCTCACSTIPTVYKAYSSTSSQSSSNIRNNNIA